MVTSSKVSNRKKFEPEIAARAKAAASYNEVVDKAALLEIALSRQYCRSSLKFSAIRREEQRTGKVATVSKFQNKVRQYLSFPKDGFAGLEIDWTAEIKDKKTNHVLLFCRSSYRIFYSGFLGCDPAAVRKFVEHTGQFATYPYFRSDVANFTSAAGVRIPVLPLLKQPVTPRVDKKTKALDSGHRRIASRSVIPKRKKD